MRFLCLLSALILVLGVPSGRADTGNTQIAFQSGENPSGSEHPPEEEKSSSKEHPASKKEPITIESVAAYLEDYVGKEAADRDGWLSVPDDRTGSPLKLRMEKIHRERLAKTDKGTYFVCADFKTTEGRVYDLDFWVKETDDGLQVTETTVHKEEGKPRYTWVEKDGIWSRKYTSDH